MANYFGRTPAALGVAAHEVIRLGQHESLVDRIIMIAQHAFRVDDLNIAYAAAAQDFRRRLTSGDARTHDALVVAFVNRLHAPHCPEGERHRSDKESPDHKLPFAFRLCFVCASASGAAAITGEP